MLTSPDPTSCLLPAPSGHLPPSKLARLLLTPLSFSAPSPLTVRSLNGSEFHVRAVRSACWSLHACTVAEPPQGLMSPCCVADAVPSTGINEMAEPCPFLMSSGHPGEDQM